MAKIDKVNKLVEKGKTDKLTALIMDKNKEVRLAAIEGLSKVPENEDSLNTLIKCMENDDDAEVRRAAAVTLGCSKGDYVDTHLRYCLSHEQDESVKAAIRESLSRIKATN